MSSTTTKMASQGNKEGKKSGSLKGKTQDFSG